MLYRHCSLLGSWPQYLKNRYGASILIMSSVYIHCSLLGSWPHFSVFGVKIQIISNVMSYLCHILIATKYRLRDYKSYFPRKNNNKQKIKLCKLITFRNIENDCQNKTLFIGTTSNPKARIPWLLSTNLRRYISRYR